MPGSFVLDDIADMIEALGRSATFRGNSINLLFLNEFDAAIVFDQEIEMQAPECLAETADVPDISHGETITIAAVTYYVIGVEPEGTGVTRIKLSKDDEG